VGWDSIVNTAIHYSLDSLGVESQLGMRFSTPVHARPGAHPAFYTMGMRVFPRLKQLGPGIDHPPHLAPRLKKE